MTCTSKPRFNNPMAVCNTQTWDFHNQTLIGLLVAFTSMPKRMADCGWVASMCSQTCGVNMEKHDFSQWKAACATSNSGTVFPRATIRRIIMLSHGLVTLWILFRHDQRNIQNPRSFDLMNSTNYYWGGQSISTNFCALAMTLGKR
jgi:hypothetical protein